MVKRNTTKDVKKKKSKKKDYHKIVNWPRKSLDNLRKTITDSEPKDKTGKVARIAGIGVTGLLESLVWLLTYVFADNHLTRYLEKHFAEMEVFKNKKGRKERIAKFMKKHPTVTSMLIWWLTVLQTIGISIMPNEYDISIFDVIQPPIRFNSLTRKKDKEDEDNGNNEPDEDEEKEYGQELDDFVTEVQENDTLWSLAIRYNTTVEKLAELNGIDPMEVLSIKKKIHTGRSKNEVTEFIYEVKSGENLSVIADRYGISTRKLAHMNNRKVNGLLKAGTKLKITIIKDETFRDEPSKVKQKQIEPQPEETTEEEEITEQTAEEIDDVDELMVMALDKYNKGDFAGAVKLYNIIIKKDKHNIDAYSDLALTYKLVGDQYKHKGYDQALENYNNACEMARKGIKLIDKFSPQESNRKASLYFNAGLARQAMGQIYVAHGDINKARKQYQAAVANFELANKFKPASVYTDYANMAQQRLNQLTLDSGPKTPKKVQQKTPQTTKTTGSKYKVNLSYVQSLDERLDEVVDLTQSAADITEQVWPLMYPLLKRNETRRIPYKQNSGEIYLTQGEGLTWKEVKNPNKPNIFGFVRIQLANDKNGGKALSKHELEVMKKAMEYSNNDERAGELKQFLQVDVVPQLQTRSLATKTWDKEKTKPVVTHRTMREVIALLDEIWNLPGNAYTTIDLLDMGEKPEISFFKIPKGYDAGIIKRRFAECAMYKGYESISTIIFQKTGSYAAGINTPGGAKEEWFVHNGWAKQATDINGKSTYEFVLTESMATRFENAISNTTGYKKHPRVCDSLIGTWREGYTNFPFYGLDEDMKKDNQSESDRQTKKQYEKELYELFKSNTTKTPHHKIMKRDLPSGFKESLVLGQSDVNKFNILDFETTAEGIRVFVEKITGHDDDESDTDQESQKKAAPAKKQQKKQPAAQNKKKDSKQQKKVTPAKKQQKKQPAVPQKKKNSNPQPKKKKGSKAQRFQTGKKIIEKKYTNKINIVNKDKSYS